MSALQRLKHLRQAQAAGSAAAEDDQLAQAAAQALSLGGTSTQAPGQLATSTTALTHTTSSPKQRSAARNPTMRQTQQQQQQSQQLVAGWRLGPLNEAGVLCELSERPLMCMAAHWSTAEVVVGSSDHALYAVDVRTGRKRRTLYTKTCGHTEWVTAVCYLPDGRVLSGGMDSDLWLWPAAGTRGSKAAGHEGPVSVVAPVGSSRAVSASYDATLRIWDVSGSQARAAATLSGHSTAVLTCCVADTSQLILSGDRSGASRVWDVETRQCVWQQDHSHKGHVTSQCWLPGPSGGAAVFASGGQDGWVRVWDTRSSQAAIKQPAHCAPGSGHGAVGDLQISNTGQGVHLLSSGADKRLQSLDSRMGYTASGSTNLPDYPYSMSVVEDLAVVGCSDGNVLVLSAESAKPIYGLGAGQAAIRCLAATSDKLVTAGDDGTCLVYSFAE